MTVEVPIEHLTISQTLHEILRVLKTPADVQHIVDEINKNTLALSGLSTHPPVVKERTMTEPAMSIEEALAAQTQAIADLAGELAEEHEQWLAAVAAGDEEAAAAVVAKVEENTAALNQMTADLEASNPDATPDQGLPEEQPVIDNTLPEETP